MNKKLSFALSLLGCCALTVGSTLAVHSASAESFVKSEKPLEDFNIYNNDYTFYNPYSPFLLFADIYNSQYTGNYIYSYSFPELYGTNFKNSGVAVTTTYYGGCTSSYNNNANIYNFFTNDGSTIPKFTLEAYGATLMCDYLDEVYVQSRETCTIGLYTMYYAENEQNYQLLTIPAQDYVEWNYNPVEDYYAISIGQLCRILLEERDNVKLWNYDTYYVEVFSLSFTADDDIEELTIYDFNYSTELGRPSPGRGLVSRAVAGHVPVVQDPENTFTFIVDSVTSFLNTEFLPNLSFGKILLIILGVVVFGLGLKIAFGG